MRLPFIQVTQETWIKARELAGLLSISRREAFGIIGDLWLWGVSLGPEDAPPTGVCEGPRAHLRMAGALDLPQNPDALRDAFVEVGLIEIQPNGLRVRGVRDRYAKAWERAQKAKERKAKWKETRRNASGTRSDGVQNATQKKKEMKTHTQMKNDSPSERVDSTGASAPTPPPPPEPAASPVGGLPTTPGMVRQLADRRREERQLPEYQEPTKHPDEWTGEDFFVWAQFKRQEAGLLGERKRPRDLGGWYSGAMMTLQGDVEALQEAFYRYGEDTYWQQRDPPLPFQGFMSQWDKYARAGEAAHAEA